MFWNPQILTPAWDAGISCEVAWSSPPNVWTAYYPAISADCIGCGYFDVWLRQSVFLVEFRCVIESILVAFGALSCNLEVSVKLQVTLSCWSFERLSLSVIHSSKVLLGSKSGHLRTVFAGSSRRLYYDGWGSYQLTSCFTLSEQSKDLVSLRNYSMHQAYFSFNCEHLEFVDAGEKYPSHYQLH